MASDPKPGQPQASRMVRLACKFPFEASHRLPKAPDDHKCRQLHGHSFSVEIICAGKADRETGWLLDFADIKAAFAPLLTQLDHCCLNDIAGLENPTAENIARWIWVHLKPDLPCLAQVNVAESATSRCEYFG